MRRTAVSFELDGTWRTYKEIVQIGITLESLVCLLDGIIANHMVFLDSEVRQLESGITITLE
jgi:hypothetical protein